ncbi:hypothetical protein PR048_006480 [Dryococelus australis]|uniref:Tesmin/TSO1-like CXC domain-containing protein n=1 Tax=Dryococelus australis TaxID=614101 RepID=A0ABQ9IB32_9NEOP|nr:hypothetical protein PR048_006480 [Dryococelus australis]
MSKEKFRANPKNKGRLISMTIDKFSSADITCKQAKEDADTLIVNTALSLAPSSETVIVVGEYVGLLVILIGLCRVENVFFLKPGKDIVSPATFSPTNTVSSTVVENFLFLHAMSVLKDSNATQEMVATVRECFLFSLYGYSGMNVPSLNHLSTGLEPVFTVLPPAPSALLKLVSCKCTKNCQRNCGCKKAGICCSNTCLNCEGNCNNIAVVSQDEEDELDLETELEMDCTPIEPVDPIEEEQAMPRDISVSYGTTIVLLSFHLKHFKNGTHSEQPTVVQSKSFCSRPASH